MPEPITSPNIVVELALVAKPSIKPTQINLNTTKPCDPSLSHTNHNLLPNIIHDSHLKEESQT